MSNDKRPVLTDVQQSLLDGVSVRLLSSENPEERIRYDQLITQEHYLHNAALVGEQLRYVAEYKGQWVALLSWSAASFNLKDREDWIQWTSKQKKRRLSLVVNNSRFLILKEYHVPNLASRVMKKCLERLSLDWQQAYGHSVLVAESFVDRQHYLGTCYKAGGWTLLGKTKGYQRSRQDFYLPHDRPKELWVRELRPAARTILRGRNLPEALREVEASHPPICIQEPEELKQMQEFFKYLPDWRQKKSDYSVCTLVTIVVCAMLCQSCLGQRDLAAFAKDLTPKQMAALKFPRRRNNRPFKIPGETTFFRLLAHLDKQALQKAILDWQNHLLGPPSQEDFQVSIDGKELLNSQGLEIVSAYNVSDQRWMGSELVAEKSNEIPAAQNLLRQIDIEGALVTADAMHTQVETAQIIVQEKGADYLFTVKGNQPTIVKNVRRLKPELTHVSPPTD